MKLPDSVFLVTGGSSGLGAAVVRMALAAGARVVIADLAEPEESDLLPEWKERWAYVHTDVAQEASATAAVQIAIGRFHRLDVLVNSAGIARAEKIHGKEGPHRLSVFAKTIEVNLIGSFNMMRLAVPAFVASGALPDPPSKGVIINTASIAAFDGQIGQTAYAASKGGIVAMTLPAARELARDQVRVMTIAPGIFETPMLKGMPQDVQDALAAGIPHPSRLGMPSEYAELVRHIVENEYLNGEVIRLDGAIRLAPR
ncbi:SDR family NAD(P)-dependent oxidoreductase [Aquabacterium sp.]|uniref:SDR family NAD(P)-dependent oxidoreductase n=1 Tax=Aquabacterium sp. TaxID=1872578 RepID=UPI00199E49B0|nr:SDR family NAD(P)-dependent oxidoreductase [Aquabacterium sp.]MBC7699194.1 SDR family NAD(P)-dependent oxidoreductase [Aquabacterium sp.]